MDKMFRSTVKAFKRLFNIAAIGRDRNHLFLRKIVTDRDFSNLEVKNRELSVVYKDKYYLRCRLWPHSDPLVLEQIFLKKEYLTAVNFVKLNLNLSRLRIIDAGANVGYSSIYFLSEFPDSQIACIEPDKGNISMLRQNLSEQLKYNQVRIFENALMGVGDKNISMSNNFRDQKDWSLTASEVMDETGTKSISIQQILDSLGWDGVDFLKMDIEGAERFIFRDGMDLNFIRKVKIICIEIHDEFNIRNEIYRQLKNKGLAILNFGETTFGINATYLINNLH